MKANGLPALYGELDPRERVAAFVAATARGDKLEQDRLMRTSPCVAVYVPVCHSLTEAVQMLACRHMQGQLDWAAQYYRAERRAAEAAALDWALSKKGSTIEALFAERMELDAGVIARLFVLNERAFEAVVGELGMDPAALLQVACPPSDVLRDMARVVPLVACSPEEFTAWFGEMAAKAGSPDAEVPTVEGIAEGLRRFLARWTEDGP